MAADRRRGRRAFLAAAGAGALAAGGWLAWRHAGGLAVDRRRGGRTSLDELVDAAPWDVLVIGSGPAGVVAAHGLAREGYRVAVLESGSTLGELAADPRFQELDRYEITGIDYPLAATRIRAIGGTSTVWTGRSARLHPIDFEPNAYSPGGRGWPIGYDTLAPWYLAAERLLGVRAGALSQFHAPREEPLPGPPPIAVENLRAMLAPAGVTVDVSPTSTGPDGEPPLRVADDLVPAYLDEGGVLAGPLTVTRLVPGQDRSVAAVEVGDLDRRLARVRARAVVIACGAVESARLLLLSRSEAWPEGPGNAHDLVGRGFMEHPNINYAGQVSHTLSTLSPGYELGRSHQFYDAFKRDGFGAALVVFSQSWVYRDDVQGWDLEALRDKAARVFDRIQHAELRISATLEMSPEPGNRVTLSERLRDLFGNPAARLNLDFSEADRRTRTHADALVRRLYAELGASDVRDRGLSWSHHHMGTCRMGDEPRHAVVDRDLRVHGVHNLYVAGSSCFVTGGAAHPTLAIVALSLRLSQHLARRLREDESLSTARSAAAAV